MSVQIKDEDHGYKRLRQEVQRFSKGVRVEVGVNSKPHSNTRGLSNEDIGKIHEFGIGVPERSFLRGWVDDNKWSIGGFLRTAALRTLFSVTKSDRWLKAFGEWAVKGVRDRIFRNIPPPLKAGTVKRKGHDTALVDTHELVDAIEYHIEQGR